jgi:hypothetical protein
MADTQTLKRLYRRMAKLSAAAPKGLAEQKAWLEETFLKRAVEADGGGFQALSDSMEGSTFAGAYKGASAEDRALALEDALTEIEAEIAAEEADEAAPAAIGCIIPRVICAPR